MKIYAVGDIHGCYKELVQLMDLIHKDIGYEKAKIVFIGDYVDRGPDSYEVVNLLNYYRLLKSTNIEYVFLKGNHEDMMLSALYKHSHQDISNWMMNGGIQTETSYQEVADIKGIPLYKAYEEHENFYDSLKLYHQHDNIVFVHAGINPNGVPDDSDYYKKQEMLWSRDWNDYSGTYKGCDLVVHGHTPVPEVKQTGHQINIDTGAVFHKRGFEQYNYLSAIRIDKVEGDLIAFKVINFPVYTD